MRITIEILPGCDKCGDDKHLQPNECLCDKCLAQSIKKDLQELKTQNYMPQDFAYKLKQKYQDRLNQIAQRQGW